MEVYSWENHLFLCYKWAIYTMAMLVIIIMSYCHDGWYSGWLHSTRTPPFLPPWKNPAAGSSQIGSCRLFGSMNLQKTNMEVHGGLVVLGLLRNPILDATVSIRFYPPVPWVKSCAVKFQAQLVKIPCSYMFVGEIATLKLQINQFFASQGVPWQGSSAGVGAGLVGRLAQKRVPMDRWVGLYLGEITMFYSRYH